MPIMTLKNEATVQNEIRLDVTRMGGDAYRNNSGVYNPKSPPTPYTRWGLGNDSEKISKIRKSSDLICCLPVVITPEMVGRTVGIYMVVEVKKQGWRYKATKTEVGQFNFINRARALGGIGCFSQSVDDLRTSIAIWKQGIKL